ETTPADFARYVRYVMENLGGGLRYVCTINEANMGVQVAAIAERYKKQMMKMAAQAQAGGQSPDGSVQMGMNCQKRIATQARIAAENTAVFGTETPQCLTNRRTPPGDELVMEAHKAARAVIP